MERIQQTNGVQLISQGRQGNVHHVGNEQYFIRSERFGGLKSLVLKGVVNTLSNKNFTDDQASSYFCCANASFAVIRLVSKASPSISFFARP